MIFERGPQAFLNGTAQLLKDCLSERSAIEQLCQYASAHIFERIVVLTTLRCSLATFLAQVCLNLFLV